MANAGNLSKGMYINWKGEPAYVVDKELHSPGKGAAVVRLRLRNVINGNVTREVLKTNESVEEVMVEHRPAQFLYSAGDQFIFMNTRTFEQYSVDKELVGEDKGFIKEGNEYQLEIYQEKVIGVKLPKKMFFIVVEAEDAVKGDTVTGATKQITLETGLVIKAPLFIKKGEEIFVNTETKEYVGRKN